MAAKQKYEKMLVLEKKVIAILEGRGEYDQQVEIEMGYFFQRDYDAESDIDDGKQKYKKTKDPAVVLKIGRGSSIRIKPNQFPTFIEVCKTFEKELMEG